MPWDLRSKTTQRAELEEGYKTMTQDEINKLHKRIADLEKGLKWVQGRIDVSVIRPTKKAEAWWTHVHDNIDRLYCGKPMENLYG